MLKKTGLLTLVMCASALILSPKVASAQGRYYGNDYGYYNAPQGYDRDAWRHEHRREERERARFERERQRECRREERLERRYEYRNYAPNYYYRPNYGLGFSYGWQRP